MISGDGTKKLFSMATEILGLEGGCYPSRPIKKPNRGMPFAAKFIQSNPFSLMPLI